MPATSATPARKTTALPSQLFDSSDSQNLTADKRKKKSVKTEREREREREREMGNHT